MKKIFALLILTLLNINLFYSQNNKTKKADRLFERLEFVKASEEYLKILDNSPDNNYVIRKLADSYYNIFNTVEAEKWYSKLSNNDSDAEVYYRYSQMLKANGKYKESMKWMTKFSEMMPYDSRAIAFRNTPNYIDKIVEKGEKFNIQNLDINSEYSDFGSTIFNNKLYFTSSRNEKRKSYGWNNEPFLDIYSSFINDKGTYLEPLNFTNLNSKYHEGIVSFTSDGNGIFFTRESYFEKEYVKADNSNTKYSQLYIYKATKMKDKWVIESLSINDKNYSNKNPYLDEEAGYLYFSSNMPGGFGLYDIYRVKLNDDGTLNEPENLGQKVNTEGQEVFPSKENNIVYFSSDGHLGLGGLDVFYSKEVDKKWSNVRNVGIPVNSAADDFAFVLNDENGYVSSNRSNINAKGSHDIYALKKIKPLCDILLESIIVDSKTKSPLSALTSVSDDTGVINNSKESNENGIVEYIFECEDKFQLFVSKDGYESKLIDIKLLDIDPPLLTIELDPIEELIIEEKIVLNPIYFDFDKSNITNQAAFELDKLVAIMKKYPKMVITAKSHTDSRGPASYNKLLSERRAKSTAQYVISKGIDENRITGVGMGEEDPEIECSSGCSKDEHAMNRRSEFIIVSR